MRISDWSSDVCSSDLARQVGKYADRVFAAIEFDQRDALGEARFGILRILGQMVVELVQRIGRVTAVDQRLRLLCGAGVGECHRRKCESTRDDGDRKSTRLNSSH